MDRTKRLFTTLFLVLVIMLMFLPFITTFNEFLTRILLTLSWYRWIQNLVVPFEIRTILYVTHIFHFQTMGSDTAISIMKDGGWHKVIISWNCIGWQSLIILILTLITGLQGDFNKVSKMEVIIIGVLGTFLVNILRITSVLVIFKFFGYLPAMIFHDYFANIAIIAWFFLFWWFSYAYVLEEKSTD